MRQKLYSFFILLICGVIANKTNAQLHFTNLGDYRRSDIFYAPVWKSIELIGGIPCENGIPIDTTGYANVGPRKFQRHCIRQHTPTNQNTDTTGNGPEETPTFISKHLKTTAYGVNVNRQFVGNHMGYAAPPDNTMAVSDNGYIVSVDNYTIDFYATCPDTLLQFADHRAFYNDTNSSFSPFDPRVTYDRENNRFILIMLNGTTSVENEILISFSKTEDPRNGWNHYKIQGDTGHLGQPFWLDYPHLGQNKDEIFITGNMFNDDTLITNLEGNAILQISKKEGYLGTPLKSRLFVDNLQADGALASSLVPLSHADLDPGYNTGIYLTNTPFFSGSKIYWYYLNGNLTSTGTTISKNQTTTTPYIPINYASQMGGDNLDGFDCRTQHGFYMNGKLYTVYTRSNSGWGQIIYNRIKISNNTNQRETWGNATGSQNYSFPSIAHIGTDTTDENVIIGFLRSGPSIYPQMCAVNHDGTAFSLSSTLIKSSTGHIEQEASPYPTAVERWGDYTTIQRKYNANPPTCWMVGQYSVGATPNNWGEVYQHNAYIAELGNTFSADTCIISPPLSVNKINANLSTIKVFPNPADNSVTVEWNNNVTNISKLSVVNLLGQTIIENNNLQNNSHLNIDVSSLSNGLYFIRLTNQLNQSYNEKIIVAH